ncbi:MAG: M23 family metallopeptidase [Fidelibacterota bacterium]|nr:MAG: M23 family metallopeptidase [Candidatus Neomarinimicrobiota bacterium]
MSISESTAPRKDSGFMTILATLGFLLIFYGCQNNPTSDADTFQFPLASYRIWQPFANKNPQFNSKYHCAEDAYGDGGTEVYAIADGKISYSGSMLGYGWLIIVDHPGHKVYSLYGHLSTRRTKATSGEVQKGEVIGYLADDDEDGSGGTYPDWGPHLHFGLRQGSRADYPDSGDDRWMAGYTVAHPNDLGWLEPTVFIEEH